jgi:hypothetical protein
MSALGRILACLLLFGLGAQALGGGAIGVLVSALVSLAANRAWRIAQEADRRAAHRTQIMEDEELRLQIRDRRETP